MPTSISVANLEAALGNAYDYVESEDFISARKELAKALFQLAGLPDVGQAGATIKYKEQADALGRAIEAAESAINRHQGPSRFMRMRARHAH